MKRPYRILLCILCLLFLGLVLFHLIYLRVGHARMHTSSWPTVHAKSAPSPDPEPSPSPSLVLKPEPTPVPTPDPTPLSGIFLEEGEDLDWPCGIPFRDPGFTAHSRSGEDLSADVTVTGEVVPWHTGVYTLTYTLPNGDTEVNRVQRTVHVVPQTTKQPIKPESGTICLTYIDTPCESTEELLKLLKRDGVKATFFISTYQAEFLDLLPQMAEDGHELGIYFPDMSWYNGEEGVLERCLSEIVQMQEIIFEKTGRYAKFIRFYGGTPNAGYLAVRTPGGFDELYRIMHEMGLLVFDWNLEVDVAEVTAKISSNFTHPSEKYEYVVAMQQNFRRQSVLAVPEMIRWGKEKGYTFSVLKDTYPEVFFGQDEVKPVPEPETDFEKPEVSADPAGALPENDISAIESTIASVISEINSMIP